MHDYTQYGPLLDDIENKSVTGVVNTQRPVPQNRRYRLVELVADTAGDVPVDIRAAAADKAPAGQIYFVGK